MNLRNEQENFWETRYSKDYIGKNSAFDYNLLIEGWKKILKNVTTPSNILECGANVGRNIEALNHIYPHASKTAIEISPDATNILQQKFSNLNVKNSSIVESEIESNSFDLTFTMGVLIHIHPNNLMQNLEKIIQSSNRYILIGEYFNRTPVSIKYQGEDDRLFKNDFGKIFQTNFNLKLVDYGFLWGHIYDSAGFDDFTWWLFKK